LLRFLSNATIETEGLSTISMVTNATIVTKTFLWLWHCLQRLLRNESVVLENLKRLVATVMFGALLIVINSCVLNFVVQ
jgi:hypothetical protein